MKRILKVQQQLGTMVKDAKNPFFKSQYLDLTTILQHVTPLLNKEGLTLLQPLTGDTVTTCIIDSETGDTLASSTLQLPNITDPQKLGSAITYFRRYTLKSLLAIAEEDDDGNKASRQQPKAKRKLTADAAKVNAKQGTPLEKIKEMFLVSKEQEGKYKLLLESK